MQRLPGGGVSQIDQRLYGGREITEDAQVALGPVTGHGVDDAQRPDRVAVLEHQWHAGVGDRRQIADREVVGDERILAGVLDDQRTARGRRRAGRRNGSAASGAPRPTGSGRPCWLLKNWRSRSTSETSETGASSSSEASRVKRSKSSSGLRVEHAQVPQRGEAGAVGDDRGAASR